MATATIAAAEIGDEGDDQRPVQAQGCEHGRHDERADGVADAAAHREDAHVGGHAAARGVARPAGALGMVAGHPGAAHGDRDEREGIARRVADGAHAETGEHEPGGQQPVCLAAVPVGADDGLEHGMRDADRQREHAGSRIAVVPLHHEEWQQGEEGARTQVGAPVPQREREQGGAGSRPAIRGAAHEALKPRAPGVATAAINSTCPLCDASAESVPCRRSQRFAAVSTRPAARRRSGVGLESRASVRSACAGYDSAGGALCRQW